MQKYPPGNLADALLSETDLIYNRYDNVQVVFWLVDCFQTRHEIPFENFFWKIITKG